MPEPRSLNPDAKTPLRWLSLTACAARVGVHRVTITRLTRIGEFPHKYPSGWIEADVDAWLRTRVAEHPAGRRRPRSRRRSA